MLPVHVRRDRPSWDCGNNETKDSWYLISHDEQVLLMGEVQHLLDTLLALHLTCRRTKTTGVVAEVQPRVWPPLTEPTCGVPGVDDAEDSGLAVLLGCLVGSLQLLSVQSPAVGFVQVVVHLHGLQLRDGSGVERILRDGDHHACPGQALTRHQQLQDALEPEGRQLARRCRAGQASVGPAARTMMPSLAPVVRYTSFQSDGTPESLLVM